jgi:hypothetical protein
MGAYSFNFYGINLTEHFGKIRKSIQETLKATDPGSPLIKNDYFDLGGYIAEIGAGESMYDGGGYGQITYIGVPVYSSKRGIVVTDEIVAEAEAKIAALPELLADAIRKVLGTIPEPEFITEEGWD